MSTTSAPTVPPKPAFTLPTVPVAALNNEPRLLVLYGPPKVGKTTIVSKLPNTLIIDTENGSSYVEALKVPASNYTDFLTIASALKTAGAPAYSAVAIDTITRVEEQAEHDATVMYKAMPIGKNFDGQSVLELPQGAGYLWLRRAFRRYVDLALQMNQRVIFLGHVREKFLTVNTKDVSAIDLDLTGKNRNIACSLADAIGHLFRDDKGVLQVCFNTKETLLCGTRCPSLAGKTFPMDWAKIYPSLYPTVKA